MGVFLALISDLMVCQELKPLKGSSILLQSVTQGSCGLQCHFIELTTFLFHMYSLTEHTLEIIEYFFRNITLSLFCMLHLI